MRSNEDVLKPMTFGDVLDYSLELYKRNFKKLMIINLIFYASFYILTLLLNYLMVGNIDQLDYYDSYLGAAYGFYILSMAVFSLIYVFTFKIVGDAAMIRIVFEDLAYQRKISVGSAIKDAFKKLPGMMGNKILFYLILLGGVILTGIAYAILMQIGVVFAYVFREDLFLSGLLALIGFFVSFFLSMILLGYFYIKFGFGVHSIIVENKSAADAISRSLTLTSKNFWHSFMSIFFGILMMLVIPMIMITQSLQFSGDQDSVVFTVLQYLLYFGGNAVLLMLYPLFITLMTVLFTNLKIRKEGFDLEVKVDTLLEEKVVPEVKNEVEVTSNDEPYTPMY
ncbi:MAG: hypothetical protein N2645_07075 [Clostridia bacterium]|nr:hypothetical protein [Clostridia bacterium]